MTCLGFRLSIASLAGTLLDYDAGLLLTLEEDSETAFEIYWSPLSRSTVGSACSLVSLQVFFRRGIPAHFLLLLRYHRLWKGSWKPLLALWSVTSWHISLRLPALPMPWTLVVVSHPKMAWRNNRSFLSKQVCNTVCLVSRVVALNISPFLPFWSPKSTFVPQKKQSDLKFKDCSVLRFKERRLRIELSLSFF